MSADASPPVPVGILVHRGERVESRHRVSYAIADAAGALRQALGEPDRPVFPRSAVKPLQALVLLESGAAERFGVSQAELALACASHGGEPMHVDVVRAWLARLGLDQSALECGAHPPTHRPSAERLIAAGQAPAPLHNNCSGKHTGMLTVARHIGAPLKGYIAAEHPVQQRVAALLAAMAGIDALPAPATDGCGIPTWPMTLAQLATAMARLADPQALSAPRRAACLEVRRAMSAHPRLVAGSGRPCTAIIGAAPEVLVKTGAEGVYAAALPDGRAVALKVDDGGQRARPPVMVAALRALGVDAEVLDELAEAPLLGGGVPVGAVRCVL